MQYLLVTDKVLNKAVAVIAWDDRQEKSIECVGRDWFKFDKSEYERFQNHERYSLAEFKDRKAFEKGKQIMHGSKSKMSDDEDESRPDTTLGSFQGLVHQFGFRRLPINEHVIEGIERDLRRVGQDRMGLPRTVEDVAYDWAVSVAEVYRIKNGEKLAA